MYKELIRNFSEYSPFSEKAKKYYKMASDLYDSKKYEEAFPLFLISLAEGHWLSLVTIGIYYSQGKGIIKQNYKIARSFYEKAAEKGCLGGLCNLGYFYENGFGVEKDENIAFELYEFSANKGYRIAIYNLATFYQKNDNIPKAVELYKKAVELGDTDGMDALTRLYLYRNIGEYEYVAKKCIKLNGSYLLNIMCKRNVNWIPELHSYWPSEDEEINKKILTILLISKYRLCSNYDYIRVLVYGITLNIIKFLMNMLQKK